jgi:hypothetical protein
MQLSKSEWDDIDFRLDALAIVKKSNKHPNEKYLLETIKNIFDITDEDVENLSTDELRKKIRDKKLKDIIE